MNWIDRIGAFGLGLFALASVWQTAPGHVGIALALPSALAAVWHRRRLRPDAATVLAALIAVWLLLRYAAQTWGGMGEPGLNAPDEVLVDWLFVPSFALLAALPCTDFVDRVRKLWILAMLGCSLGVIGFLHSRGLAVLWSGQRLGFHLNRPLGIGLYAGAFVIVLLATARQWWHIPGRLRWPARLAGIAAAALHLQVLMSAQNRSTYLASAVVAGGGMVIGLVRLARNNTSRPARRGWLLGLAAMAVVALVVAANLKVVEHRVEAERQAMDVVVDQGLAAAPAASVTVRLRLWQYVLERFPDAPLIGHGFGDLKDVIDRDLRPRVALLEGERYDHVHNSYLQTLWTQGLVGIALWAALSAVLVRDAVRAARTDRRVAALLPAMWGVLAFVAVWACFDYRLSHPDMRFFSILLLLSLRLLGRAGEDGADARLASR